ncbi:uncharacterized protein V2V93DRAFT_264358 [Kockiozyma suomiensis]|uniref:uncharacterized protein n=1 Tax=Kockiozyma suomiensis TaxID=1337062 RepID=UPI0033441621
MSKLDAVIAVFRPLHEAVTRVNAPSATLADICISWAALAVYYHDLFVLAPTSEQHSMDKQNSNAPYISNDLRNYIVTHSNMRSSQQLKTSSRATSALTLALFVHPVMALHEVLIKSAEQHSRVVNELYEQMSTIIDNSSFRNQLAHQQMPQQVQQQYSAILYEDLAKFRHRVDIYGRSIDDIGPSSSSGNGPLRYWTDICENAKNNYNQADSIGDCKKPSILPQLAKRIYEICGFHMRLSRVHDTVDWLDSNLRSNIKSELILDMLQCRMYYLAESADPASTDQSNGSLTADAESDDEGSVDHAIEDPLDDFDVDADIEYMHDYRNKLVHRYDSDTTENVNPSKERPETSQVSDNRSPPLSLSAAFENSAESSSSAKAADGSYNDASSSGDHLFEIENFVTLANFRRTGFCFDTLFSSTGSSNLQISASSSLSNMPTPTQYSQPATISYSTPIQSQLGQYAGLYAPASYLFNPTPTQPFPPYRTQAQHYNEMASLYATTSGTGGSAVRDQNSPPHPYYQQPQQYQRASGVPAAGSGYAIPPLSTHTSSMSMPIGGIQNLSVSTSQKAQTQSLHQSQQVLQQQQQQQSSQAQSSAKNLRNEWTDIQRFDSFDL